MKNSKFVIDRLSKLLEQGLMSPKNIANVIPKLFEEDFLKFVYDLLSNI